MREKKKWLDSFDHLKNETYCPFAYTAKIQREFNWNKKLSFIDNIKIHANSLKSFTEYAQKQKYHGFASKIFIGSNAKDFEATRKKFKEYLFTLAKFDQDCFFTLKQEKINTSWQFSFNNLRMFLNVFSPCYSKSHSKYIDSKDSIYIFFQPEYSFKLCGSKPLNRSIVLSIRNKFSNAGQTYSGEMIDQRIESYLYMFPAELEDPPVIWWE